MREHLSFYDICNEISMSRTVYSGAFVLVEGVTDDRVYGKFLASEAHIIQCHSKDAVKRCLTELVQRRGVKEVIGIADADLDLLEDKRPSPPLFYTDCRDMEMMCIESNAFDDIIDEYGDREKVRSFEDRYGSVRDSVIEASYPVGLLMHVSKKGGLGLNFGDLDVSRFVNPRTISIDMAAMIDVVVMNSRPSGISKKTLLRQLEDEIRNLDDPWIAARGHDTVAILLLVLQKGLGSFNARSLTEGALGGSLRLAFSDSDFARTQLYADTKKWADEAGLDLWNIKE
ncbi:MAG: DUF4435 domain-containing protein [Candidatus Methanomethylophilaceae archaeon]|jgi:hypothetical protein|nr:DUF4435 domain-containing protein [Candidatus Methanomethylophilaceae archaeon]MBR4181349.1 DUF4435 domain-containing protein [Candidatus Methanomethylophilaceae archaeon]